MHEDEDLVEISAASGLSLYSAYMSQCQQT